MTSLAEPVLGVALPVDDPAATARAAALLRDTALRLATLARAVAALLPVRRWSGVAAAAADRLLLDTALALGGERSRLLSAADALDGFSRSVAESRRLADEAQSLLASAYAVQGRADRRDPSLAAARVAGSWSGPRDDGRLYDPAAVALLDRARTCAFEARDGYDHAARRLVVELTALSGRRVVRASLSPRVLLDVVGLVPVVGDAVDAVNAAVYLRQHRWGEAALTGAAVVPGPEGWYAGGLKMLRAARHVGDVQRVVDDVPAGARAVQHLDGLLVRGRRRGVRLLPDDATVERFYEDLLSPLGRTTSLTDSRGTVLVTELSGGGNVTFRRFSESGGWTIDINDVPGSSVTRVHRADHAGPHD